MQAVSCGGALGAAEAASAAAALRAGLEAEGRRTTDFSSWFTCRLLTPVQHAACGAACYPFMPDTLAMADVLAAEAAGGL